MTGLLDSPDTELNFLPMNIRVHVSPTQLAWLPFEIPAGNNIDFTAGLKTIAGSGDPTLHKGIATYIYAVNSDKKSAFIYSENRFLTYPLQEPLDIQIELSMLLVQRRKIVVIQRGQKFKVALLDGPSRGYILEIWGTNFEFLSLANSLLTACQTLETSFTPGLSMR